MNTRHPFHAICDLFPRPDAEDLERIESSIRSHGGLMQVPVVWQDPQTNERWIVDGKTRVTVCERLGLDFGTRTFVGAYDEMVRHVIDLNLNRRHLTPSQIAAVKIKAAGGLAELARIIDSTSDDEPKGRAADRVAESLGVSPTTVKRAERLRKESPEKLDEVIAGESSLREAAGELPSGRGPAGPKITPTETAEQSSPITMADPGKQASAASSGTAGLTDEEWLAIWNGKLKAKAREASESTKGFAEFLTEMGVPNDAELFRDVEMKAKNLAEAFRHAVAVASCPKCKRKGCPFCFHRGCLNKNDYDRYIGQLEHNKRMRVA